MGSSLLLLLPRLEGQGSYQLTHLLQSHWVEAAQGLRHEGDAGNVLPPTELLHVGDSHVQYSIAASSPGRNDNVTRTSCSAGQKSAPLPDRNEAGLHSCVVDGIPHLVMLADLLPPVPQ